MLPRSSSDAAIRLRRTKSSSSVQRSPPAHLTEPFDAEAAQHHAQIAALTAYEKAHGRRDPMYSVPNSAAPRRSRRSSNASEGRHLVAHRESGRRNTVSTANSRPGSEARLQVPERQQSVAGSTATSRPSLRLVPSSRATSRARTHTISEAETSVLAPPRYVRKAQSSIDFTEKTSGVNKEQLLNEYVKSQQDIIYDNHESTLQSISECDLQALPQINERVFSPFIGQNSLDPILEPEEEPAERLVRKRTSFISTPFAGRGRSNTYEPVHTTTTSIVTYDNMHHSTTHTESASNLPAYELPPNRKTRSMSSTLRDKIMRVFRRSSQTQPAAPLPQQQVVASRAHFGDLWDVTPTYFSSTAADIPPQGVDTLSRPRSRTLSLNQIHPEAGQALGSRQSSGSSRKTETQTRSRVTSWTDSTAADTIRTGHNKRLSVIDEYGMPRPVRELGQVEEEGNNLAPVATPMLGRRIYDRLMRRQSEAATVAASENEIQSASPDIADTRSNNERVCTPLPAGASAVSVHATLPSKQRRVSSLASRAREAAKSTIRAVTPDSRRVSSRASHRKEISSPLPPTRQMEEEAAFTFDPLPGGFPTPPRFLPAYRTGSTEDIAPTAAQVANRVARSRDRWKSPLDVRAEKLPPISARDFAKRCPQQDAVLRTSSKSNVNVLHSELDTVNGRLQNDINAIFSPVERPASRSDLHGTISPSLYSRATDDYSPVKRGDNDSIVSLDHQTPFPNLEAGTAVVLPSYRISPGSASPKKSALKHKPTHSVQSSRDWRAWLSNEVAELETREKFELGGDFVMRFAEQKRDPDRDYVRIEEEYGSEYQRNSRKSSTGPSMIGSWNGSALSGHRREHAQIVDGEGTHMDIEAVLDMYKRKASGASAISQEATTSRRVSNASGILRKPVTALTKVEKDSDQSKEKTEEKGKGKESERPPLVERSSSRMNDRFPMLDTGRPPSRTNHLKPPSSASEQRAPSAASSRQPQDKNKENVPIVEVPIAERSTSVFLTSSSQTASNTLTVPENPLLSGAHKPKSMIPLRTRTEPSSSQPRSRESRKRSHNRTQTPVITQQNGDENMPPSQQLSVTPTISVTPHSSNKGFVTPSTRSARDSLPSSPPRPRSTADLHDIRSAMDSNVDASANDSESGTGRGPRPVSVQSIRRKPLATASRPSLFDDATVRRIVEGPYARDASSISKENRPATPKSLRTKKSTGSIGGSSGVYVYTPTGGQKMADEWLKRRIGGGVYGAAVGTSHIGESGASEWSDEAGSPRFV
ncbi:hypothetical protein NA57DRAFT_70699 [Rhizodiscina lignyota]|uniref:Uncharacterized protein n=1 Tax=Rhizodiscina lignyota TaxID=1504668 RepID=A0A9P4IMZ0_9PEZI|nr:hypothetical protein NA57DRAFT_70699 [Rhizodiscina lignyota]